MTRLRDLFRRRPTRVRIDITCPHGMFIPASYAIGNAGRLGCKHCPLRVEVSWLRGDLDA